MACCSNVVTPLITGLPDEFEGDTVWLEYQLPGSSLTFYGPSSRTRYRVTQGVPFEAAVGDAKDFLARKRRNRLLFAISEQNEEGADDTPIDAAALEEVANEDANGKDDGLKDYNKVVESLSSVKGIGIATAEKLASANVTTVEQVAALDVDKATEITGLSSGKAQSIIDNAAGE